MRLLLALMVVGALGCSSEAQPSRPDLASRHDLTPDLQQRPCGDIGARYPSADPDCEGNVGCKALGIDYCNCTCVLCENELCVRGICDDSCYTLWDFGNWRRDLGVPDRQPDRRSTDQP